MSVAGQSRFQKHYSQRILQNEVRENAVDTGAASAERRSLRRKARPTTVSNIEELLSMWSSLSESRVSAFPRFPGSKGLPGTPSPAGSRRQPKCCRRFNHRRVAGFAAEELQADEIRTFAGNKKTPSWVFVTIEVWSRLWPSTVTGRRSYRNISGLFNQHLSQKSLPQSCSSKSVTSGSDCKHIYGLSEEPSWVLRAMTGNLRARSQSL